MWGLSLCVGALLACAGCACAGGLWRGAVQVKLLRQSGDMVGLEGRVIGIDPTRDLAVLKVRGVRVHGCQVEDLGLSVLAVRRVRGALAPPSPWPSAWALP